MLTPLDRRCRSLQFSAPLTPDEYTQIANFLVDYPWVALRAYGDYKREIRDLEFLRYFRQVRRVSIELWGLEDISGLGYLTDGLEVLGLGANRHRLSLRPLQRFRRLRGLSIEGQTKDIAVVRELVDLQNVALRSITLPDLSVLLPLRRLQALAIHLGGTRDLRILPLIGNLRYLELWMIRGLADIGEVGRVPTLEHLVLQDLRRVERLPPFHEATSLMRIHLENMKGLLDVSPLATAPSLRELLLVGMGHLPVESLGCLAAKARTLSVLAGLGSNRKNEAARLLFPLPPPRLFPEHPAIELT
jgi:internalin A